MARTVKGVLTSVVIITGNGTNGERREEVREVRLHQRFVWGLAANTTGCSRILIIDFAGDL